MKQTKNVLVRGLQSILLPVVVYLLFLVLSGGKFGTPSIMLVVARQSVMPIMLAYGVMCNMSMGMWDFSSGAVIYCAAIIGGNLAKQWDLGMFGVLILCILVAMGLTALTGLLYRLLKLPALVLSIGICLCYEALSQSVFGGRVNIPLSYAALGREPIVFVIFAIGFALIYLIYNKTTYGKNVQLIGDNQAVAASAGLKIASIKHGSFVLGGFYLGVYAALFLATNATVYAPGAMGSMTMIFDAMMGIFIGMFLSRYCNYVVGVTIGAFTIKMLSTGLVSVGISASVQDIITGLFMLVLLAVSANQNVVAEIRRKKHDAAVANAEYAGAGRTVE